MKNSEYMLFPEPDKTSRNPSLLIGFFVVVCMISLLLYALIFSNLKLPYSVGIYERMLNTKRSHFTQKSQPRLLIAAGSNARVSHNSAILEGELGISVTNGGLSAAVSTAFVLESYMSVLERGDICYLPLEYEPLLLNKRNQHLDAKYALAYDKSMFRNFSFAEKISAVFSHELNHIFISAAEQVVVRQMEATSEREEINERGDQANYDEKTAARFRQALATMEGPEIPSIVVLKQRPEMVRKLEAFLDWCSDNGVLAIGGLPTTFEDTQIDIHLLEGLRDLYESRGHEFIILPNLSRYPRNMFYDSKYHLSKDGAILHSRNLAFKLSPIIENFLERSKK